MRDSNLFRWWWFAKRGDVGEYRNRVMRGAGEPVGCTPFDIFADDVRPIIFGHIQTWAGRFREPEIIGTTGSEGVA